MTRGRIIARVLGYLEDNRERMDYPRYRRQGLPGRPVTWSRR